MCTNTGKSLYQSEFYMYILLQSRLHMASIKRCEPISGNMAPFPTVPPCQPLGLLPNVRHYPAVWRNGHEVLGTRLFILALDRGPL